MTVPNADRAIIAAGKLTTYLLNVSHKRGGAKARLLLSVGYRYDAPQMLESLSIILVNPATSCCSNPMGVDNIVLKR